MVRTIARPVAPPHDETTPEVAPRRWFGVSLVIGVIGLIMVGVLLLAVAVWIDARWALWSRMQRDSGGAAA